MMNLIAMLFAALALGAADVASAGDALFSLAAWTAPDDAVRETYALLPDDARAARTEAGRDWTGISGDTALVPGAQVTVAGPVYLLPGDVPGASTAENDELLGTGSRHGR